MNPSNNMTTRTTKPARAKTKKVKASIMWSRPATIIAKIIQPSTTLILTPSIKGDYTEPVLVIPADAESYDAMIEQADRALWKAEQLRANGTTTPGNAEIVLAAIGIVRPSGDGESPDALRKRQPKREGAS